MSLLHVARQGERGIRYKFYWPSIGTDELAYRLLRWVALFLYAQIEKHPILVEKAAAHLSCSGEINLSEKQRKEGWRSAKDEAGHWYAYFEAGDANFPESGSTT